MAAQLTDLAERFLRRLEKALLPLPPFRRDAVLRHYRTRLSAYSRLGYEPLREALKDLGSAEEIAAPYLEAERALPAGDISACTALVPMPGHGNLPALLGQIHASPRGLLQDIRSSLAATREGLFPICGIMFATWTGLSTLASYHALVGAGAEARTWDLLFGVAVISLTMTALFRAALRWTGLVWEIGSPLVLVAAAAGAIGAVSAILSSLLRLPFAAFLDALPRLSLASHVAMVAADTVATICVAAACLRLLPWVAARAIGRDDIGLAACWQRTARRRNSMIKGWALFVLPLFVAHGALRVVALANPVFGGYHLALGAADAIVITVAMLMGGMLTCMAYRWVVGEAIPEPLPFASETPPEFQVRAARDRLSLVHDARRFTPATPLFGGASRPGLGAGNPPL